MSHAWEELYLLQGHLMTETEARARYYRCVPPDKLLAPLSAGDAGAQLLCVTYGSELLKDPQPEGKRQVEVDDFEKLIWSEIPARRPDDPGGRVAELSSDGSRTRTTSLLECRAGWRLHDHDHASDVLTFCIRGGGLLGIDQQDRSYEAGEFVVIPAGVRHRFEAGADGALLIVFTFEQFLTV
jgi:quercetin dioxygenase-like cupin family protein